MRASRAVAGRRGVDDGQAVAELLIVTPLLLAFAALVVAFGRLESFRGDVQQAAAAAADLAAVQPDAALADSRATASVLAQLSSVCPAPAVVVDAADFAPGGVVRVTVRCKATLSRVSVVGIPGSETFTATAVAPIDPYRSFVGAPEGAAGGAGSAP